MTEEEIRQVFVEIDSIAMLVVGGSCCILEACVFVLVTCYTLINCRHNNKTKKYVMMTFPMSNMLAMDADDDTVSEPVAIVVVAEAVDGSNNIGASSTTQQSNKTMWKKT